MAADLIPNEAVEAAALVARNGQPHDGSDQDLAVDADIRLFLEAALPYLAGLGDRQLTAAVKAFDMAQNMRDEDRPDEADEYAAQGEAIVRRLASGENPDG